MKKYSLNCYLGRKYCTMYIFIIYINISTTYCTHKSVISVATNISNVKKSQHKWAQTKRFIKKTLKIV